MRQEYIKGPEQLSGATPLEGGTTVSRFWKPGLQGRGAKDGAQKSPRPKETLREHEQLMTPARPPNPPPAESHPDREGRPPSHSHSLPGLQPQGPGRCTPPLERAADERAPGCQQAECLFY